VAQRHENAEPGVSVEATGARRQEHELFRRVGHGDRRAREELAARYMPLARSMAWRYRRSFEALDDLLQVASVGLIKAIDRYDPSRGVAFGSYAVPTIAGELKRYFRDYSWAVRPPRELQELTQHVDRVQSELTRQLGRTPTTAELCEAAGIDEEKLLDAIQADSAHAAVSLQASSGADGAIEEKLGSDDGGIASAETNADLDALLLCLTPRQRLVLRLRFNEDMTQAEIAALIGVGQMQISRIIRQALQRLRDAAERQPQPPLAPSGSRSASRPL
jgi:RNA polymerase sigma-B factor